MTDTEAKFSTSFDAYACPHEEIQCEHDGFRIFARIKHDPFSDIDDDDCHNPDRSVTGCNEEQQKQLLAARAAWLAEEWFYCGIVLSVWRKNVCLSDNAAALWGIECNYPGSKNEYLTEVANELLPEAIAEGRKILDSLCSE